jgi:hypothetical protein
MSDDSEGRRSDCAVCLNNFMMNRGAEGNDTAYWQLARTVYCFANPAILDQVSIPYVLDGQRS